MWSPNKKKPGSISAMTASSGASVFRPMCRSACQASAAVSKRRRGREFEEFPELVSYLTRRFPNVSRQQNAPQAQGEIHYHDTSAIEREIALYKRIAGEGKPFARVVDDGALARHHRFHHAQCLLRYQRSLPRRDRARDAQRISSDPQSRGLALQIDAPDLAMDRTMFYRDGSDADFVKACELHVAMINKGTEGIRPTACGCMSATAIGKGRTFTTSRSRRFCRRSIRPRSARCRSSFPTRAMRTNTRRCSACRFPQT